MAEDKYGKFHSLSVKEWGLHTDGADYKSYLKTTEKGKLTPQQKEDLDRLKDYEAGSEKEDETSTSYDAGSVDYSKIKSIYGVAGFLSMEDLPDFFLSESNLHTRNFVLSEYKEKSIFQIVEEAKKKVGESGKDKKKDDKENDKETENQEDKTEEQEEKPAEKSKPTLFAIITKGFGGKGESSVSDRENYEENDLHSTIEKYVDENNRQVSNNSNEPISKETREDLENKAQQILDEEQ